MAPIRFGFSLALASLFIAVSCTDQADPVQVAKPRRALQSPLVAGEGELFGNTYGSSGERAANVWVKLVPTVTVLSQPSLLHVPFDSLEWADTAIGSSDNSRNFMYDWADPANTARCGTLPGYNSGGSRGNEVHRPGPNQPAPNREEQHCVRPGTYTLSFSHNSNGSSPVWSQIVDYLQIPGGNLINNTTAGVYEFVEYPTYSESNVGLTDLAVDFTEGNTAGHSDTLDIDNAGLDWLASTFTDAVSPSGTTDDWFRFSVARTQSEWSGRGKYLARIYYDRIYHLDRVTGFYNSASNHSTIRPHRYVNDVLSSRTASAALEVITPGETPAGPSVTRSITVNLCVTAEQLYTWLTSDQRLRLACGTGPGIQYRWRTDSLGSWSAYSSVPAFDFLGHSTSGTHLISAQAYNSGTGTTSTYNVHMDVINSRDTLDGPTYVTDKGTKVYHSRMALNSNVNVGNWFEQWPPDTTWYVASYSPADSLRRIWPAGNYTVEERWDSSTGSVLRRARLEVEVCNPERLCDRFAPPPAPVNDWSFFGGGPWLAGPSAQGAVRLYEFLGQPDQPSPFADRSWFDGEIGGSASSAGIGASLRWRRVALSLPNARAFAFEAGSSQAGAIEIALAVDPDVGADASNDRTGFDAIRGMVYVYDTDGAVGYLLRDSALSDALNTVIQYGVSRRPPRSALASLMAMRSGATLLMSGPSDVQLLLAPPRVTAPQTWTLVIVRGGTVEQLGAQADSALAALGWR